MSEKLSDKIGSQNVWDCIAAKEKREKRGDIIGSQDNLNRIAEKEDREKRLKAMGHDRVMADLGKKYKIPQRGSSDNQDTPAGGPINSAKTQKRIVDKEESADIPVWLAHMDKKDEQLRNALEGLPIRHDTINKEELNQVIAIKKWLVGCIKRFEADSSRYKVGSPQYVEICIQYIEEIIKILDVQKIWAYKFSTELAGGAANDAPLEKPSDDDSIYYVTPNNISLRLKIIEKNNGLGAVVQDFFEKIVFKKVISGEVLPELSLKPELCFTVVEHTSADFVKQLAQDRVMKDFRSLMEIYYKNNLPVFVNRGAGGVEHKGDRVNKIFFDRT
jgi:hypothetical protein